MQGEHLAKRQAMFTLQIRWKHKTFGGEYKITQESADHLLIIYGQCGFETEVSLTFYIRLSEPGRWSIIQDLSFQLCDFT